LGTAGSLTAVTNATTQFKPLITSSPDAMLVPVADIKQYQEDVAMLMQAYKPQGSFILAGRITGPIKSPYTDKEIANSNIIVVADGDLLHDHFWVNFQKMLGQEFGIPTAANGNFVVSVLDNLTGSDALISIRNRGTFVRPFTALQQLEIAAQSDDPEARVLADKKLKAMETQVKFFGVALVPLIIVVCGFAAWLMQIRREAKSKAH
jgi:ABC-type uncharacterized transport system involved in gliding motility auxiliary subunit